MRGPISTKYTRVCDNQCYFKVQVNKILRTRPAKTSQAVTRLANHGGRPGRRHLGVEICRAPQVLARLGPARSWGRGACGLSRRFCVEFGARVRGPERLRTLLQWGPRRGESDYWLLVLLR